MPKFEEVYHGPSKEDLHKNTIKEELQTMGYSFDAEGGVILDEKGEPILKEGKKYFDPVDQKNQSGRSRGVIRMNAELAEGLEDADEVEDFEEVDIMGEIIAQIKKEKDHERKEDLDKRPEFSSEEASFMEASFRSWFKKRLSGERSLTKIKELEMIAEFKENFPIKYAEITNRRVLPDKIEWKKEMFKDRQGKIKEGLVSYYPNKENSSIKYVLKTTGKPVMPKSEKFFASQFIADKKNGAVIFCEEVKPRISSSKKTPIKKVLKRQAVS